MSRRLFLIARPCLIAILFTFCLSTRFVLAAGISDSTNIGTVIDHIPASTRTYVGSPSIVIMPDGSYVASHDYFGPGCPNDTTAVFGSNDRGKTWSKLATIKGQWWSTLFLLNDELYLMGTSRDVGTVVIRRSSDGGRSWTNPDNSEAGLLLHQEDDYSCAPGAVVVNNGRVWRAMENPSPGGSKHHYAFLMSAPVNADLLMASSWIISSPVASSPEWLQDKFGGWSEGNAVVMPNGEMADILRANYNTGTEKAAIIHVSVDGRSATFDPEHDFAEFPGGSKKFTIRFDPVSRLYWALVNPVPATAASGHDNIRNTLALSSSPDLVKWTMRSIIIHNPDTKKHGFQYPDWQFDGDDIIAVVRTASDDEFGGAHTFHDANYFTFSRIEHFRSLNVKTPDDAVTPIDTPDFSISGSGFRIETLDNDKIAFSNRKYVWREIPEKLRGWHYTQTDGGSHPQISIRAKHDTIIQVITAIDQQGLGMAGWEQTDIGFHYNDKNNTRMVLFKKRLASGEQIDIPKGNWTGGLVLLPD